MSDYSAGSIAHAHRNDRVRDWLFKLTVGEQDDLRRIYAGHIGCPLDEVPPWDMGLMDDDELDWLHSVCGSQIDRL